MGNVMNVFLVIIGLGIIGFVLCKVIFKGGLKVGGKAPKAEAVAGSPAENGASAPRAHSPRTKKISTVKHSIEDEEETVKDFARETNGDTY